MEAENKQKATRSYARISY